MGYKSPLYGRSTGQLEVLPFDYYDSSLLFEKYSNVDYYLFSKGGYTKAVRERAVKDGTVLVSVDDLFNDI